MCFGYGNLITPDVVTQTALDGASALSGFPVGNLEYDDPWLMLKTATPSSQPYIRLDLGSGRTFNCIGLVNHNLVNGWTGFGLDAGASFTGAWTPCDTDATWATGLGDPNVLFRITTTQVGVRYIRLRPVKASAWPAFQLGMIFLGTLYEVAQNPVDRGFVHTTDALFSTRRAAGGALYSLSAPDVRPERVQIDFRKMPNTQVALLEQQTVGKIVGVIPPGGAASVLPNGKPHFFGRMRPFTASDREYAAGDHRWDATLIGEGIV